MKLTRRLSSILILLMSTSVAQAEKNAALKPVLAKPGKVMAEDAFASAELSKTWSVSKGDWVIKDGALAGVFKESDHHPAVLTLSVPNRSSIIQFSFKFDGEKGFEVL